LSTCGADSRVRCAGVASETAHGMLGVMRVRILVSVFLLVLSVVAASGCRGGKPDFADEAPITPHQLEPNEQMRELAEQQCRDNPSLENGEINAVDPENPEQVLAQVVVECDEVRASDE